MTPVGPALYGAVVQVGHPHVVLRRVAAAGLGLVVLGRVRRPLRGHAGRARGDARRNSWTEIAADRARRRCSRPTRCAPCRSGPRCSLRWPRARSRRCSAGERRWAGASGAPSLASAAGALVVLGLARAPHVRRPDAGAGLGRAAHSTGSRPGTKVLDDWGLGGFLMWRYPRLDLVMHGYGDTFTTAELDRNNGFLAGRPGLGARPARHRRPGGGAAPVVAAGLRADRHEGWTRRARVSESLVMLRAPRLALAAPRWPAGFAG